MPLVRSSQGAIGTGLRVRRSGASGRSRAASATHPSRMSVDPTRLNAVGAPALATPQETRRPSSSMATRCSHGSAARMWGERVDRVGLGAGPLARLADRARGARNQSRTFRVHGLSYARERTDACRLVPRRRMAKYGAPAARASASAAPPFSAPRSSCGGREALSLERPDLDDAVGNCARASRHDLDGFVETCGVDDRESCDREWRGHERSPRGRGA